VLEPRVEVMVFALQPSEVTGPVALGNGRYALFQVVEHVANRQFAPDVEAELRSAAFGQWLAERRANAIVERWVGQ
jgi:hypothetical protein